MRLYLALGVPPDSLTPRPPPGVQATWIPLHSFFLPTEPGAGAAGLGELSSAGVRSSCHAASAGPGGQGVGELAREPGIAPFLDQLAGLLAR